MLEELLLQLREQDLLLNEDLPTSITVRLKWRFFTKIVTPSTLSSEVFTSSGHQIPIMKDTLIFVSFVAKILSITPCFCSQDADMFSTPPASPKTDNSMDHIALCVEHLFE
jgi:hypothetical protein